MAIVLWNYNFRYHTLIDRLSPVSPHQLQPESFTLFEEISAIYRTNELWLRMRVLKVAHSSITMHGWCINGCVELLHTRLARPLALPICIMPLFEEACILKSRTFSASHHIFDSASLCECFWCWFRQCTKWCLSHFRLPSFMCSLQMMLIPAPYIHIYVC